MNKKKSPKKYPFDIADGNIALLLFICALPLVLVATCVAYFGVDVLFWDEWVIWDKLVQSLSNNHFELSSLWAQQNEQRNTAARVAGLMFMPFFKLNRFPEYYLILLMAVANVGLLSTLYARTKKHFGIEHNNWVHVGFALLIFSTLQWQVYTVGVNTSIVLTITCLLLGTLLMANRELGPLKFVLLILVGVTASFNFANGLFYWFCLLVPLVAAKLERKPKLVYCAIWLLVAALVWYLYFNNYTKPTHHPSLTYCLTHPFSFIGFYLTYLGAPACSDDLPFVIALILGTAGSCLLLANLWLLFQKNKKLLPALIPWFIILAFALMSDLATAVGRAGFGIQNSALQSRYVAFSSLFWASLMVLFVVTSKVYATHTRPQHTEKKPRNYHEKYHLGFFGVGFGVYIISSILCVLALFPRHDKLMRGQNELFRLTKDKHIERIFPDAAYLKHILPVFFNNRLSVYRDIKTFDAYQQSTTSTPAGVLESIEVQQASNDAISGVLLRGWAVDPTTNTPAKYVLIVADNKIVYLARPLDPRKDLHKKLPFASTHALGWELFIPADYFSQKNVNIKAYALLNDNMRVVPLASETETNITLPQPSYPAYIIEKYFFTE